jgi:dTDP-glucose pyrophosphorylase
MKDITILPDETIRDAMKALNKTAEKCLLVVNEKKKLLGTLTDGDLRRSILAGASVSESINTIYHRNPSVVVKGGFTPNDAEMMLREKKLDLIPVVDKGGIVIDYLTWSKLGNAKKQTKKLDSVPVVIMAGGRGSRMEPFTKILPKPLVPIHEKPVIEHIIERFTKVGCKEYYLTVNYKSRILKAYFEELQPHYSVYFVDEQKPLGTAGCLYLLKGVITKPFFVSNCDIIIKADYASLYDFHIKGGYDVTLVASTKEFVIPYGTCELNEDGHLSRIDEKPRYNFLINTGLYVLNPDILELIPENAFFHITHLIEKLKDNERNVGVYPIDDDAWIDIGQWAEYRKAVELL